MALILNIETATHICSVALADNGKIIALKESSRVNAHASQITLFIDEVMRRGNVTLKNLHAVAVSRGPGSYTGLRIGVSAAKGVCYALNKPLIAVDTLQALAFGAVEQHKVQGAVYCPAIDARRMEVYTALLDDQCNYLEEPGAKIADENFCKELLQNREVVFFGTALMKIRPLLQNTNAVFLEGVNCSAKNMVVLSEKRYREDNFTNLAYFEPFYLKPFASKNILN